MAIDMLKNVLKYSAGFVLVVATYIGIESYMKTLTTDLPQEIEDFLNNVDEDEQDSSQIENKTEDLNTKNNSELKTDLEDSTNKLLENISISIANNNSNTSKEKVENDSISVLKYTNPPKEKFHDDLTFDKEEQLENDSDSSGVEESDSSNSILVEDEFSVSNPILVKDEITYNQDEITYSQDESSYSNPLFLKDEISDNKEELSYSTPILLEDDISVSTPKIRNSINNKQNLKSICESKEIVF
jgi:hypothetical protein